MENKSRLEIQAAKQMKALMKQHFMELDEASRTKNKKIAWCSSVGPGVCCDIVFPQVALKVWSYTSVDYDVS